jgi:hypothetical protein
LDWRQARHFDEFDIVDGQGDDFRQTGGMVLVLVEVDGLAAGLLDSDMGAGRR